MPRDDAATTVPPRPWRSRDREGRRIGVELGRTAGAAQLIHAPGVLADPALFLGLGFGDEPPRHDGAFRGVNADRHRFMLVVMSVLGDGLRVVF